MFSFLCTIYQVAPSFLDFVFPFGMNEEAQDFYFSGLKGEYRLAPDEKTCVLPSLGRSGRNLRFYYNLRSVEPTQSQSSLPWSIRQCALYHTFDVENGKMIWIVIKENKTIQRRVTEAAERSTQSSNPLKCRSSAFAAALRTHLLLCNWSGENWRWYINDLEDQLQSLTRGVSALEVEKSPSPLSSPKITSPRISVGPFASLSRSHTLRPILTGQAWTRANTLRECPQTYTRTTTTTFDNQSCSVWASAQRASASPEAKRWKSAMDDLGGLLARPLRSDTVNSSSTFGDEKTLLASPKAMVSPETQLASSGGGVDKDSDKFTLKNLQAIQHIEQKTQEAMLVLKLNTDVLEQLRLHYDEVAEHAEFPQELKDGCKINLHRFNKGIVGVEKDMHMLQSRTKTLLHLLANRKNLVSTIPSRIIIRLGG